MNTINMIENLDSAALLAEQGNFDEAFYALDKSLDCSDRTDSELCRIDLTYDYIHHLKAA